MNKAKIMLIVAGAVSGLLVIAGVVLVALAFSAKTAAIEGDDENEGLESVESAAKQLSHKDIYPSAESVKAIADNIEKLNEWKDEAIKLASRGDRSYATTTPSAFKTFVVADAKRLQEGFEFGPFKEYVAGGKLPDAAELAKLQRQWDDISLITEILQKSGMQKLTALEFAKANEETAEEDTSAKPKKGKAKKGKKSAEDAAKFNPAKESYVFTCVIAPDGLIRALNEFETCERFVVVEGFSFKRQHDVIIAALGGGEQKSESNATGRRRSRRRAAAAQEEPKEEENKSSIITDPQVDPPLNLTLTVSIYDFRSMEESKEEEKTEE